MIDPEALESAIADVCGLIAADLVRSVEAAVEQQIFLPLNLEGDALDRRIVCISVLAAAMVRLAGVMPPPEMGALYRALIREVGLQRAPLRARMH